MPLFIQMLTMQSPTKLVIKSNTSVDVYLRFEVPFELSQMKDAGLCRREKEMFSG